MDWEFLLTIGINLAAVAATAGMVLTRINQLEKDVDRLHVEAKDTRELKADLAVLKTKLDYITSCIARVADTVDRRFSNEIHSIRNDASNP